MSVHLYIQIEGRKPHIEQYTLSDLINLEDFEGTVPDNQLLELCASVAKEIVDNFNSHLRPGEKPRTQLS